MILFLSYEVPFGDDKGKRDWLGACSCHPYNEVSAAASMAWIEGDAAYSVYQPINPGGYALTRSGTFTELKQRVETGLALRTRFEAAKAEKVPEKRKNARRLDADGVEIRRVLWTERLRGGTREVWVGSGSASRPLGDRREGPILERGAVMRSAASATSGSTRW